MRTPFRQRQQQGGIILILVVVILFALVISASLFIQSVSMQRSLAQAQRRLGYCQVAMSSGRAHAIAVLDNSYAEDVSTNLSGRWMTAFHQPRKWEPSTDYVLGDVVIDPNDAGAEDGWAYWYTCISDPGGTSGATLPAFTHTYGDQIVDGTMQWVVLKGNAPHTSNLLENVSLGLADYYSPHQDFTTHDGQARWYQVGLYDEDWNLVEDGQDARYAVRYAVGIIDQSGLLLANWAKSYDVTSNAADNYHDRLKSRGVWSNSYGSYGSEHKLHNRKDELTGLLYLIGPNAIHEWNVRRAPTTSSYNSAPGDPSQWVPYSNPADSQSTRGAYLTKTEMVEGYASIRVEYLFKDVMSGERFTTSTNYHDAYNWSTIARELGANTDGNRAMVEYVELFTPFGNGVVDPAGDGNGNGKTEDDIQWHVNVNTAPREVLRAMIRLTDYYLKGGTRTPDGQPNSPTLPRDPDNNSEDPAYIMAIDNQVTTVEQFRAMAVADQVALTDSFAPLYTVGAANGGKMELKAPRPGLDALAERLLNGLADDGETHWTGDPAQPLDFARPAQYSRDIRPLSSNQDILDLFKIPPPPVWEASTTYNYGDRVVAPADVGTPQQLTRWYVCTATSGAEVGGTSGGAVPSFPNAAGGSVVDNDIRWHCIDGFTYDPRIKALVDGIHGMKLSVRKSKMFRVIVKSQVYDLTMGQAKAEMDVNFVYHLAPRDALEFDAATGVWSWPNLMPPATDKWLDASHLLYIKHIVK